MAQLWGGRFTGIVIRAFMPLLALIVEIMTCRERQ